MGKGLANVTLATLYLLPMGWLIDNPGQEIDAGDYDGTVWLWELVSEDGTKRRPVRVKITGTAMVMDDLHWRVAAARDRQGETEVARVVAWQEPPEEIEFHSASRTPDYNGGDPGPEMREIAEITDWFEDRDIIMFFGGSGYGTGPHPPPITRWTAYLADRDKDELVAHFGGPPRLEAARKAREWWQREREGKITTISPATETDVALPVTAAGSAASAPTPKISAEQAARLRRLKQHIVWTAPTPDDPDSGWMIEVLDDAGHLLGIAVQREAQDALITVLEDLVPPGEST